MILSTEEFRSRAESHALKTTGSLDILSGFIKSSAVGWISEHINSNVNVRLVGRFSPSDILKDASDLDVYLRCKELGWSLGILNNLHSKVFIFDKKNILLGSANLTMRGLSLGGYGNIELGTEVIPTNKDLSRIDNMLNDVTWLNDDLYNLMKLELDNFDRNLNDSESFNWSNDLKEKLNPQIKTLWVNDLLFTKPYEFINLIEKLNNNKDISNEDIYHDLKLLNIDTSKTITNDLIVKGYLNSKSFKWLENLLKNNVEHEYKNFGWVTQNLHNTLLDDPAPSRGGVKSLVSNLFEWVQHFGSNKIESTKYKMTTSLNIKENKI
jgi:hypothetical protein